MTIVPTKGNIHEQRENKLIAGIYQVFSTITNNNPVRRFIFWQRQDVIQFPDSFQHLVWIHP